MIWFVLTFLYLKYDLVNITYKSSYARIGDSFVAICSSHVDNEISWMFEGKKINGKNEYRVMKSTGKSTLFIGVVEPSMFGLYTCSNGFSSAEFELKNYDDAVRVVGCQSIYVAVNTPDLHVSCQIKLLGELSGKSLWTKNDELIVNSSKLMYFDWGFILVDITEEDQGLYSLIMLTENGVIIKESLNIHIIAVPKVHFDASNIGMGVDNVITCSVTSPTFVKIYLNATGNITRKEVTNKCTDYYYDGRLCNFSLTIVPTHVGHYKMACIAESEYGNSVVLRTFRALEIPMEPIGSLQDGHIFIWDGISGYSNDPFDPHYVSGFIFTVESNNLTKTIDLQGTMRSLDLNNFINSSGLYIITMTAVNLGLHSVTRRTIIKYEVETPRMKAMVVVNTFTAGISTAVVLVIAFGIILIIKLIQRRHDHFVVT